MPVAEPNHELTDSEAQAFQPEPHLQDLLKRLQPGSAAPPDASGVPADRPDPARKPSDGHEGRRPPRSSQQGLQ